MKRIHTFTANDGKVFSTAAECKRHEEGEHLVIALSELTPDLVRAALNRSHIMLADTFERAGNIIASKRRESGELRRTKKVAAE